MKTEITSEQAIGKTVKGFLSSERSPQLVVYFNDDTFTTFGVEIKYNSIIVPKKIDWLEFGYEEDLLKAGMISEQEWLFMCRKKDRIEKEAIEQRDIAEFERLKAKFNQSNVTEGKHAN